MSVTAPFYRFPDVQRVVVTDLTALVGAGRAAIETPPNLADLLPFVRVMRVGGFSDTLNDHAVIDIDVFAGTYNTGELLAEQVRQRLVGPPPPAAELDRVEVEVAPRELPWGDGAVRRWGATYRVVARRRLI